MQHIPAEAGARPRPELRSPTVAVVMGVSGSGKTTAARRLAETLGWPFQEGDGLHPPENVAKMTGGTPLTDEDRWPWLRAVAGVIDGWLARGESGVLTCSALKRAYRDIIVGGRPRVRLVYLAGGEDLIAGRMAKRQGHYMPAALLHSQFETLEPPAPDERPITVAIDQPAEAIVAEILRQLAMRDGEG